MIDPAHWKKLRAMDPQEVAERCLAPYDKATGKYRLRMLDEDVLIHPGNEYVKWADPALANAKPPGFHHWMVAVVYLLSAKAEPPTADWVQPNAITYGEFFFRGPHTLPTDSIVQAFKDDPEGFARAAIALGGTPWAQGQNAFVLPALPRVPILVQFWPADDEFPARAGFLFDRNVCEHLAIDALFSLVILVAKRLTQAGRES